MTFLRKYPVYYLYISMLIGKYKQLHFGSLHFCSQTIVQRSVKQSGYVMRFLPLFDLLLSLYNG